MDLSIELNKISILGQLKDIIIKSCATNNFFQESDIEIATIKDGISLSIVGTKVFEIKNEKILYCKKIIVDKFSLFPYSDKYKIKDDLFMLPVFDVNLFLHSFQKYADSIFMYCLKLVQVDTFGCCSRFLDCSNEKKCVNPYRDLYLGCCYRIHIENGKIFYGKNKNV